MCFFLKRRKLDSIASKIAARYNMEDDYHAARCHGLSPIEALEEWDLIMPDDYDLFEKKKKYRG